MIGNILIRPLITEASMKNAEIGKFTFQVHRFSDKTMIKKAVEEQFKVNVVNVTTSILKGRSKRFGTSRVEVKQPHIKKAIVKLASGQKIDFFDVGGSEEKKK